MPKEFKLGMVNAGRVNRRGKANLSHDCSYTTQFAKVTPCFCKLMLPNSSLRGSISTEVRVMPMPLPPHGVVKLHRYGQFVPIREVWKPFPEFLSGTVYSSSSLQYIPDAMPSVPTSIRLPKWDGTKLKLNPEGSNINGVSVLSLLFGRRGSFWAAYPLGNVSTQSDDNFNTVNLSSINIKQGSSVISKSFEDLEPLRDYNKTDIIYPSYLMKYHITDMSFDYTGSYFSTSMVNALLGFLSLKPDNENGKTVQPNGLSQSSRCTTKQECNSVGLSPLSCDYKFILRYRLPSDVTKAVTGSSTFRSAVENNTQEINFASVGSSYGHILVCVKLSEQGRELKKVLDVLGCVPSPSQIDVPFNLLSLVAYYKAWFDIYNPQRNISWRGTFVYRMVDWMQEHNINPATWLRFNNSDKKFSVFSDFVNFLSWLFTHCSECFPSTDANYFSAAISQFDSSSTTEGENPNYKNISFDEGVINAGSKQGADYIGTPSTSSGGGRLGDAPVIQFGSSTSTNALTWNAVRLLRGLTKYINANSVLGQSVNKFISAHFGGIAGEDLNSTFAGSKVIDVKLGDVIQTATTTEAKAGEFAGVGYGAGDFKISYKTKEAGYFFVLDSIIPQANYVQGCDYDSMLTKQLEFPTPEFDAIGYDKIIRGEIYHSNVGFNTATSSDAFGVYGKNVFGYIPRYTGHKIKKSVLTGDFVLPGTRDLYAGFTLDNLISYDVEKTSSTGTGMTITNVRPIQFTAGQDWRFVGKYKYRNNFDRIFYNPSDESANLTNAAFENSGNVPRGDDFLVFNDISVSYNMPLLSVGNSFDTIDGADNYVEHS